MKLRIRKQFGIWWAIDCGFYLGMGNSPLEAFKDAQRMQRATRQDIGNGDYVLVIP